MGRILSSLPECENQFRVKSVGSKVTQWNAARKLLKIRFAAINLTSCEATFPHECWHTTGLSFAHSKRRTDIVGDEIYEVALLCADAHRIADDRPKAEMTKLIRAIIAGRAVAINLPTLGSH